MMTLTRCLSEPERQRGSLITTRAGARALTSPLNSRRRIMRFAICFALLALPSAALAQRPNVVLILMDDLGRNDVGCYGSTYYRTPHIDRLAAGGVRFTDAYAACPVC